MFIPMITNQKLLDECQAEIAKKYKLGDKLVTGHRKGYFDEASELYAQKLIEAHHKRVFGSSIV